MPLFKTGDATVADDDVDGNGTQRKHTQNTATQHVGGSDLDNRTHWGIKIRITPI